MNGAFCILNTEATQEIINCGLMMLRPWNFWILKIHDDWMNETIWIGTSEKERKKKKSQYPDNK